MLILVVESHDRSWKHSSSWVSLTLRQRTSQVYSKVLFDENISHWDYSEPSIYSLKCSIHPLFLCSCLQQTFCVCPAEKAELPFIRAAEQTANHPALYYLSSSNQFGVICLLFTSSVASLFAIIASLSTLGGSSSCPFVPLFFSPFGTLVTSCLNWKMTVFDSHSGWLENPTGLMNGFKS